MLFVRENIDPLSRSLLEKVFQFSDPFVITKTAFSGLVILLKRFRSAVHSDSTTSKHFYSESKWVFAYLFLRHRVSNLCIQKHTTEKASAKTSINQPQSPPKTFQLATNYRSHSGIVNCAQSIIGLISRFWPYSIDTLAPEKGIVDGPKPVFLDGWDDDNVRYVRR